VQNWNHLLPQQHVDFRNYVLSYLGRHGPSCETFVSSYLVQLVATLTKLGWSTSEEHQQIVSEVRRTLEDQMRACAAIDDAHPVATYT